MAEVALVVARAHPLLVLWFTSAVVGRGFPPVAPATTAAAFFITVVAEVAVDDVKADEATTTASEDVESADEKALGRMEGSSTARELVWDRSSEPDDIFASTVKVASELPPFRSPRPRPISDSRVEKDESDSRNEPENNINKYFSVKWQCYTKNKTQKCIHVAIWRKFF